MTTRTNDKTPTTETDESSDRGLCEIINLAFAHRQPGDPCPFHSHDLTELPDGWSG